MPLKSTNNTKFYEEQHQKNKQPARLSKLDAEGVIGLSPPYKGTAERSNATKKPHIKMEKPTDFLGGLQPVIVLIAFELTLSVAFVLHQF